MKHFLIIVIFLALTGCNNKRENKVECDSGFNTGWVDYAYITDTQVVFKEKGVHVALNPGVGYTYRKMVEGEICRNYRKKIN